MYFRPPDIVVGGLIFYQCFVFFFSSSSFSSSNLRARWTELNHIRPHVRNLEYSLPLQIGGPKHLFRGFRNFTANLTAHIFGTKQGTHKRANALQTTGVSYSYVISKHELWSTNGFKLEVSFHPPSINSAFHFIARLRRRRSANGTQPNFAKRWTVGPRPR